MSLLIFYIPILIGLVFRKVNIITEEEVEPLMKYVIFLAFPCLIIDVFSSRSISEIGESAIMVIFFSFMTVTFSLVTIFSIIKSIKLGFDRQTQGVLILTSSFQNAAFLPLTISAIVWGEAGIIMVAFYIITNHMVSNIGGPIIAAIFSTQDVNKMDIVKSAFTYPPLVATILGFIFLLIPFGLPQTAKDIVSFIGDTTIPLLLFVIGLRLNFELCGIKENLTAFLLVITIRFVFSPLLNLIVLDKFVLSEMVRSIIILESGMPPALVNMVLAERYNLNRNLTSQLISTLTAASLLLIPLWLII